MQLKCDLHNCRGDELASADCETLQGANRDTWVSCDLRDGAIASAHPNNGAPILEVYLNFEGCTVNCKNWGYGRYLISSHLLVIFSSLSYRGRTTMDLRRFLLGFGPREPRSPRRPLRSAQRRYATSPVQPAMSARPSRLGWQ